MEILGRLLDFKDDKYKQFISSLIPNISKEKIIGIRTKDLRNIVKEITNSNMDQEYLNKVNHNYYEENLIHIYLINEIKYYDECINRITAFLPYIDNWAVSDGLKPKIFFKNKDKLIKYIYILLKSNHAYTLRVAINFLQIYYLDDYFKKEYLNLVCNIKSDEYYVNMMIAWYFATALVKKYDYAIKILEEHKLNHWTHNKTIQKALESYRIDNNIKNYLRSLKY